MFPRLLPVTACSLLGALSGCAGGGELAARLDAPAVEVSARDAMKQLRFRAEAHTSDQIAAGLVRVLVGPDAGEAEAGQVRVTVYRGEDVVEDPDPRDDVVLCATEDDVSVPKDAFAGCTGACQQSFVVVFAAEGLEALDSVALPVSVEAELIYENAMVAPAQDFLRLTLESSSAQL